MITTNEDKINAFELINEIVHENVGKENDKEIIGELLIDLLYFGQWG